MAVVLTIDGVTKDFEEGSLRLSQTANGRATASFSVESIDGSYRPPPDTQTILTENGTRILGALVDSPDEEGLVGGARDSIVTTINAVDFTAYAERRYVKETIPAGTLSERMAIFATYLAPYGVTLDPGQVSGPVLPEVIYDYRPLTEALNETMTLTADLGETYLWRIDAFNVLKAYQPSTTPAPFNLIGNDLPQVIGDIKVETSRGRGYANRVIVKVPSKTEFDRVESFTGDGTTSTFSLQYTVLKHYGHVLVGSGGGETLGTPEAGGGGQWSYDAATNTIQRLAGASVAGETYNFQFDGAFNGLGLAEDAGEIASVGLWEKVVVVEAVPSDTTAQAIAEAELARRRQVSITITYTTRETGLEPGQSQTVTVPRRNINVSAVISEIEISDFNKDSLLRRVTAVVDDSQTNIGRGWRDTYKKWGADITGSAVAVSAATPGVIPPSQGGPGGEHLDVQFNFGNTFGGDAEFKYNPNTKSLVCGSLSSITAGSPQSCQVFGYNCHIADA